MGADMMRTHHITAIRALARCRIRQGIVRTPHLTFRNTRFSLWDRHDLFLLSILAHQTLHCSYVTYTFPGMAKEYLILYSLQQQFPSYKASSAATFTGWRRHYEKTILPVKAKGGMDAPRITKRQDSRLDVQSTPAG